MAIYIFQRSIQWSSIVVLALQALTGCSGKAPETPQVKNQHEAGLFADNYLNEEYARRESECRTTPGRIWVTIGGGTCARVFNDGQKPCKDGAECEAGICITQPLSKHQRPNQPLEGKCPANEAITCCTCYVPLVQGNPQGSSCFDYSSH